MPVQDTEEVQSMKEGYRQKYVSYALWPLQPLSFSLPYIVPWEVDLYKWHHLDPMSDNFK